LGEGKGKFPSKMIAWLEKEENLRPFRKGGGKTRGRRLFQQPAKKFLGNAQFHEKPDEEGSPPPCNMSAVKKKGTTERPAK